MAKDNRSSYEKGYTDHSLGREKYSGGGSEVRRVTNFVGVGASSKDREAAREYNAGWTASKRGSGDSGK